MLDSDKPFVETRAATSEQRAAIARLIRELQRLHPENCTPTMFAEMRRAFVAELQQHLQTISQYEVLNRAAQKLLQETTFGGMPEWSPELIAELSEGLGDEFKDL